MTKSRCDNGLCETMDEALAALELAIEETTRGGKPDIDDELALLSRSDEFEPWCGLLSKALVMKKPEDARLCMLVMSFLTAEMDAEGYRWFRC